MYVVYRTTYVQCTLYIVHVHTFIYFILSDDELLLAENINVDLLQIVFKHEWTWLFLPSFLFDIFTWKSLKRKVMQSHAQFLRRLSFTEIINISGPCILCLIRPRNYRLIHFIKRRLKMQIFLWNIYRMTRKKQFFLVECDSTNNFYTYILHIVF